ncbi:MAG: hypothetical protein ABIG64_00155 [Candidatus Omnitrophota bacterium]
MDLNMGRIIFAKSFYAKPAKKVKPLSRLQQDYMGSFLRSQLSTLQNILISVENSKRYQSGYIQESMKRIEKNIHRFRKVCSN